MRKSLDEAAVRRVAGNGRPVAQRRRQRRLAMLGAAVLMIPNCTLRAANYYWDIDGATSGSGPDSTPTGTWNTSNTNWSTASAGNIATTTWFSGSTAVFSASTDATGAFTVTISGNQTAAGVDFEEGTVTLSGGTLTLLGSGAAIDVAGSLFATISSIIAGTVGLTKSNSGTLVLAGTSTFTGAVTVSGGEIQLNSGHDLTISLGLNIGTVQTGGDGTFTLDGSGSTLTVGSTTSLGLFGHTGTLNVQNSASATFTGSLLLGKSGVDSSKGFMNVLGGADVTAGNVEIGNGTSTNQQATLTVSGSGSTFGQTAASTLIVGNVSGNVAANLILGSSGTFTTGTGLTTINAGGLIDIQASGTLNANGDITVSGGTLQRALSGTFTWASGKTMTVQGGGTASFSGSYTLPSSANVSIIGSTLEDTNNNIEIDNGAQVNVTAAGLISATGLKVGIAGAGTLTVDGSGSSATATSLSIWGHSTPASNVTFSNGATGTLAALDIGDNSLANSGGVVNVQSGASLSIANLTLNKTGGTTITAILNISSGGASVAQSGASTLLVGAGSAALTINSGGSFTSGTGTTTINGLIDIAGGTFNANGDIIFNGGTLRQSAAGSTFNWASTKTMTLNSGGATLDIASGTTLTVAGTITGVGALTKTSAGTLILTGTNTYGGATTISAGTIRLISAGGVSSSSALTVASGATFDVNSLSPTIGSLAGAGNVTLGTGSLTAGGDNTSTSYSGGISGAGTFTKTGAGTLTLSGTNSCSVTNVGGGVLQLASGGQLNSTSNLVVFGASQLNILAGGSASAGVLNVGTSGGDGTLTVSGSGAALTISGATGMGTGGGGGIDGNLTFSSGAVGSLAGLVMTNSGGINNTSQVTVQSGADVTASGDVVIGQGVQTGQNSTILVTGSGSSFIQSGAAALTVGAASTSSASLTVSSSGVFTTGTGTTTLNATGLIDIAGGTFNANGDIVFNGGTLRESGSSFNWPASKTMTINSGATFDIISPSALTAAGTIAGTGALTKTGSGVLTLGGTNTYSGGTNINGGTISVSANNNLGNDIGALTFNGGTLSATAAFASGRAITLNSSGGTLSSSATNTFSGVVSGTGALTVSGTGTVVLLATNTFLGAVTINGGGTLQISADNRLGNAANNLTLDGGTLSTTSGFSMSRTITPGSGGGTISVKSTFSSFTLSTALPANSNALTKTGPGDLFLNGTSSRTGTTTINDGAVRLNNGSALGTGSITITATGELGLSGVTCGQPLSLGGSGFVFSTLSTSTYTGTITVVPSSSPNLGSGIGNTMVIGDGPNDLTGGAGALLHSFGASGTVVLPYSNDYAGGWQTDGATLRIQNANSLGTGTSAVVNNYGLEIGGVTLDRAITMNNNSTLRGTGTAASNGTATVTTGAAITLASGTSAANVLTVGNAANDFTGGSASSTVTVSGSGKVVLAQSSNYTGGWTLSSGTLELSASGALGNSSNSITFGGSGSTAATLQIGVASVNISNAITVGNGSSGTATLGGTYASGTSTFSGNITLQKALTLNVASGGTLAVTGIIDDDTSSFAITKTGAGMLVLSGSNTYSGTTSINAGTLQISAEENLGSGSSLSMNGGTLACTADLSILRNISLSGSGGTVSVSSPNTLVLAGTLSGAGALTVTGAGVVSLTASNTYSGGTTITSGTGRVSADNNLGNTAGALTFNAGTLDITAAFSTSRSITLGSGGGTFSPDAGTVTLAGTIGGTGALTKVDVGALRLDGTNSYSGGTVFNAGTVSVSADNNLGNTAGPLTFTGGTLNTTASLSTARAIAINGTGGTLNIDSGTTLTVTGAIAGTSSLTKSGAGTLALTGSSSFSGALAIAAGNLRLSGTAGFCAASSIGLDVGTTLELNSATAGNHSSNNRISDSATIILDGGTFALVGAASTATIETVGTVIPHSGGSTISLTNGAIGTTTLTFAALGTRVNPGTSSYTGATVDFVASSDIGNTNKVIFSSAPSSPLPLWATVNGADFTKYDNTAGIIPFAGGDYSINTFNEPTGGVHVKLNSAVGSPPVPTTVGTVSELSLNISATNAAVNVTQNNGTTLTLSSGGLLKSGTNTATLSNGTLQSGIGELLIYTSGGDLRLAGSIGESVSSTALVKSGPGTLILGNGDTVSNTFTGITYINGGILKLDKADGTLAINNDIVLAGGELNLLRPNQIANGATVTIARGTLDFKGQNDTITRLDNTGGTLLFNHATVTVNNSVTLSGGNTVVGSNLVITGTAAPSSRGSLTIDGGSNQVMESSTITVNGDLNFTGSSNPSITLTAGSPSASLSFNGYLIVSGSGSTAQIVSTTPIGGQSRGVLDLAGSTRKFAINNGSAAVDMLINTTVSNGAVLMDEGSGTLRFETSNNYSGGTTLAQGTLEAAHPNALGSGPVIFKGGKLNLRSDLSTAAFGNNIAPFDPTSPIFVDINKDLNKGSTTAANFSLGSLSIGSTILANEFTGVSTITLTFTGATVLTTTFAPTIKAAIPLVLAGPVSGSFGFIKSGLGTLYLGASNSFTGLVTVATNGGTLRLGNANALGPAPSLFIGIGATLDLNGFSQSLTSLSGLGAIALGNGTLTLGSGNAGVPFAGRISGSGGLTKIGSGTLTASSVLINTLTVNGGTAKLTGGGTNTSRTATLTVAPSAALDLDNNKLLIDYVGSSPDVTIRQYLINGRGGVGIGNASWAGTGGITSSAIVNAGDTDGLAVGYREAQPPDFDVDPVTSFGGQTVDDTAILIRYTYAGDANLDGRVDRDDLNILSNSFGQTSGVDWLHGDFDYNGTCDRDDYNLLSNNFGSDPFPSASMLTASFGSDFAESLAGSRAAAVPEPTSLGLIALPTIALAWRRRRCRN